MARERARREPKAEQAEGPAQPVREVLLGELAVRAGLVTREQLATCLAYQEKRRVKEQKVPRIGEVLAHKKFLSREQVTALLAGKYNRQRGLFGEIAVRLGLVSADAVERALRRQKKERKAGRRPPQIGQILRAEKRIRTHHILAILRAQGRTVALCLHCKKQFTVQDFEPGRFRCKRCQALLVEQKPGRSARAAAPAAADDVDIATPRKRRRLPPGAVVRGYRIEALLGEDMTGSLYRARDEQKDRLASFKVLDSEWLADPRTLKAFLVGAQKSAALNHPAIKRLFAVGKEDDYYFVAMEYVAGDSLRQVLQRARKLPVPMVIKVAMQVVDALIHAASRDLIHKDVRPSNILVAENGQVKVSGFGVPVDLGGNLRLFARDRRESACYLAPELVVDGARVDSRADIFGLGATLYHLLSGRPPLHGRSPVDVLLRLGEKGIPPLRQIVPKAPPDLDRLISRMIELEPGDRHQSLYQLERELEVIGSSIPGLDV